MGRKHRPFFRLCAMDVRAPRDGRVLEELGIYDPMVPETDARAILKGDRIDYWIGVGALPSPKAAILIKKYGTDGTNLEAQKAALEKMNQKRSQPFVPKNEVPATKAAEEAPAEETAVADAAPADDASADNAPADAAPAAE